ncbi:MAG: hypothetical protein D6732_08615 [Methanobacteriota archaeon]|nr:MAG: hypothetical protein D6732_08615 [Euryarchaeota archaeon]
MKRIIFRTILSFTLVMILVGSNMNAANLAAFPDPAVAQSSTQQIVFEDGSSVDIEVIGNFTRLTFSDGAIITINASTGLSVIEFWESADSANFTRITITQQVALDSYPDPFMDEAPATGTSIKYEFIDISTERVMQSWEMLSVQSFDNTTPSVAEIKGYSDDGISMKTFKTMIARNATHFGASISATDSAIPTEVVELDLVGPAFNPTNTTLRLRNDNGGDLFAPNITTGTDSKNSNSFFDIPLNLIQSGNQQDHRIKGSSNEASGSFIEYSNITSGITDLQGIEPGLSPLPLRYPSPISVDDPTIPFDVLDVILAVESITIIYGGFSLNLYLDKLVINYETLGGIYIPIVILFEVWEVHISIYEISIIIYLEVIELVMVIVVYEVIKIEVYIQYIVIVIEILQITLIEITIIHIDIDILVINISITINVWIFKIIVKVVKKIIVFIPLWIIIIPVFIPVPVPVPVFIPVPTPIPVPLPQTDVDLYDQAINEASGTMNLTYFVSDEYGNPLSNANVTLTMDTRPSSTYVAKEDSSMPGYYFFTNLPLDSPVTINVTADFGVLYRPVGILVHTMNLIDTTATVTQVVTTTTNVTSTVPGPITTTTTTITVNGTQQGTGTSSVPFSLSMVVVSFFLIVVSTNIRRKRKV